MQFFTKIALPAATLVACVAAQANKTGNDVIKNLNYIGFNYEDLALEAGALASADDKTNMIDHLQNITSFITYKETLQQPNVTHEATQYGISAGGHNSVVQVRRFLSVLNTKVDLFTDDEKSKIVDALHAQYAGSYTFTRYTAQFAPEVLDIVIASDEVLLGNLNSTITLYGGSP